jgi:hypothetical protein
LRPVEFIRPSRIVPCPGATARKEPNPMSLVFYYAPMSTASISQLVLEELGVPCEGAWRQRCSARPAYAKVMAPANR